MIFQSINLTRIQTRPNTNTNTNKTPIVSSFFCLLIISCAYFGTAYAEEPYNTKRSPPLILQTNDYCAKPVTTNQGPIIGTTSNSEPVCEYKGIPYARPPVGKLRWKPPQRPDIRHRYNPLIANHFDNSCIGLALGLTLIETLVGPASEDCLYLNIWRPNSEVADPSEALPVMLWIHGGANVYGSGSEIPYRGGKLASKEKVIVVTFNYRLGIFGYYGDNSNTAVPRNRRYFDKADVAGLKGNYGLLDQIAALKWVSENISRFGGDPDNITLFGESAGSWAVCHMLTTPQSQGLFHKAIMESAGCTQVNNKQQALSTIDDVRGYFGCNHRREEDARACMRSKSTIELSLGQSKPFFKKYVIESMVTDFPYRSYVDGNILPELPTRALEMGRFNSVPVLAGTMPREDRPFFSVPLIWHWFESAQMMLNRLLPQLHLSVGELRKVYPSPAYANDKERVRAAWGDFYLACPSIKAVDKISALRPSSTYEYQFGFDGFGLLGFLFNRAHGMDLPFVFNNMDLFKFIYTPYAWNNTIPPLIELTQRYWANFARHGDPNNTLGSSQLVHSSYLPQWRPTAESGLAMVLNTPTSLSDMRKETAQCDLLEKHGAVF